MNVNKILKFPIPPTLRPVYLPLPSPYPFPLIVYIVYERSSIR